MFVTRNTYDATVNVVTTSIKHGVKKWNHFSCVFCGFLALFWVNFGYHFGALLTPWEDTFDHHFLNGILDSSFGGPREQKVFEMERSAAGAGPLVTRIWQDLGS